MHALGRCIRFSIDPFLAKQQAGYNAFASKPMGEGLSIFLELVVEVTGEVAPETGFVVNVTEIDRVARESAVPVLSEHIKAAFQQRRHIGFGEVSEILQTAAGILADRLKGLRLNKLTLKLNPLRGIAMHLDEPNTIYFSEKFEFAAMHKLWNDEFTPERNFEIFGKCANPSGHGHNYIVEVVVKRLAGTQDFNVADFESTVDTEFVQIVDHKNLNEDVAEFRKTNPTIENIAVFAWNRLRGKLRPATARPHSPKSGGLHCVTVWESQRTYCSYYG